MTFYFYDTETSGIRPSSSRIMQFAGIRTNDQLQPVGEPDDILIKLTPDILPDPDAILIHGITPQQTLQDGFTEAEFAHYFSTKIATPDTVFVGFNSIRFDDEFVRYFMYRNFYEPYEWQWKDGRSRWDLLDALRMMRALRPNGMNWPFDANGKPTVRLEQITTINSIQHANAHTALADVQATIEVARKMRSAQPKLFDYLLNIRGKKEVQKIVESGNPFLYTSGKYSGDFNKTTLVSMLLKHPKRDAAIVYDLRVDPMPLFDLSVEELATRWKAKFGEDIERLPLKTLQYNRCPAVAPQSVLDVKGTAEGIGLNVTDAKNNLKTLQANAEFVSKIAKALGILEENQAQLNLDTGDVDTQLYDSFWNDYDRHVLKMVRDHAPATLEELAQKLKSKRMQKLLPLYKARNYPQFLSDEEHDAWEVYRQEKLFMNTEEGAYVRFAKRLQELQKEKTNKNDQYLLAELQLYAESIIPASNLI